MDVTDPSSLMPISASICFDRLDFTRNDFSVEKFLLKARAGGHPFERIRDDLRVLLRIVQNSMIELINKDYAEFVNLSSNLVGLATIIEKLKSETSELLNDLSGITSKIDAAAKSLYEKFGLKHDCIEQQSTLRRGIDIYNNLKRLNSLLDCLEINDEDATTLAPRLMRLNYYVDRISLLCPKNVISETKTSDLNDFFSWTLSRYQNLLEKAFVSEIKSSNNIASMKVQRNLAVILDSFTCCGRLDAALACFLNEFIDGKFRSKFPQKNFNEYQQAENLKQLLNDLTQCGLDFSQYFTHDDYKGFLCDSLLTYLLNFLDEHCSNLIFATDARAFRQAYYSLCEFFDKSLFRSKSNQNQVTDISLSANVGLIRLIFQKFNVDVYYQLRKKEVTEKLISSFEALSINIFDIKSDKFTNGHANESRNDAECDSNKTGGFLLDISEQTFSIIRFIWSLNPSDDGIYLPCLASRCIELSFIVLNMYQQFANSLANALTRVNVAGAAVSVDKPISNSSDFNTRQIKQCNYRVICQALVQAAADAHYLSVRLTDKSPLALLSRETCATSLCPTKSVTATMAKALSERGDELRATLRCMVEQRVVDCVVAEASVASSLVAEVPRRYRWTRKEAPERASPYVARIFEHLEFLATTFERFLPTTDATTATSSGEILTSALNRCALTYAEQLSAVVGDVEKVSSSLSKLKRGGTKSTAVVGGESSTSMSDDEKIRAQLKLDVAEFGRLADSLPLLVAWDSTILKNLVDGHWTLSASTDQ